MEYSELCSSLTTLPQLQKAGRSYWQGKPSPGMAGGSQELNVFMPTGSFCAKGTGGCFRKADLETVQSTCVPLQPKCLLDV